MRDLENSISELQSMREEKKQSVFEFTTITIILYSLLGGLFYYFSKYLYGSEECVYLRLWSVYFAYFCLMIILTRLFIFLPTYYFTVRG